MQPRNRLGSVHNLIHTWLQPGGPAAMVNSGQPFQRLEKETVETVVAEFASRLVSPS